MTPAQPHPSMPTSFLQRGGLWVLAQSVLMLAVIALGVGFHGDWANLPVVVCGGVCFLLGAVVGLSGVVVLGTSRTPFPRPPERTHLVQHGIYARMRHPLYTSVILASVGWALIWQSWPALVAALALGPFFDAKARREERWLIDAFPEYAGYARRVRRFLPGIY
jgi:protein-S-isoprenylcysteine O-methyltransferase Ste14